MSRHLALAALASLSFACGASTEGLEAEGLEPIEQAIDGSLSFVNCTPQREAALRRAISFGRWLADTPEYTSCMTNGFTQSGTTFRYQACGNDSAKTVQAGVTASNSRNAIQIECRTMANTAAAQWAPFGHGNTERVAVSNAWVDANLSPANPHGLGRLAKVVWHELMHQQGFVHDLSCPGGNNSPTSMPLMAEGCFHVTAPSLTATRLAFNGYSGARLNVRAKVIDAAIMQGGVASNTTLDTTMWAVAWERELVAQHSGKCLVAENGLIVQRTCTGTQRFITVPMTDISSTQLVLMSTNGKCIDRPSGAVANHTLLQPFDCHAGLAQRFVIRSTKQIEAIDINGALSGQCLDIPNESTADGVAVQMSTCKTSNIGNQVFALRF